MKILNNIYSHYKLLSWLSLRILQATLCIFCATLLAAVILMLFPEIAQDPVHAVLMTDELLNCAPRNLALGTITALSSDIIIHM